MPTYDYECRACGHEFDCIQRMSAGALRKCPDCGELRLRRRIGSGAGVIFKGSGFYETDYKRNRTGSKRKQADETSTPDTSSGKSDAKSKDAAKSSSKADGDGSKSESKAASSD
jgi:putative FmdB family regulatory protein